MEYYASLDDQSVGPLDAPALQKLRQFGPDLLVWPKGYSNWVAARSVPELALLFEKRPPVPGGHSAPNQIPHSSDQKTLSPVPASGRVSDTRECPFCSEVIKAKAVKCRYCDSILTVEAVALFRKELNALRKDSQKFQVGAAGAEAMSEALRAKVEGASQSGGDIRSTEHNPQAVRRLATILFADFSGFTALSGTRAPEEMREIMNAFFSDLAGSIERYGGQIDKYIGDCVMAIWGLETSNDEDPIRATAAALSMLSRVRSRSERIGISLTLHAGIDTGEVVLGIIGSGNEASSTVVGSAVTSASQLCDSAPSGKLFVGQETWKRLGGRFDGQSMDVELKGTGLSMVFDVSQGRKYGPRSTPRVVKKFIPIQDRTAKISSFIEELRSGPASSAGVLVSGHGGTGKSRLCAHSLSHHAGGMKVLFGQGIPADSPTIGATVMSWLNQIFGGSTTASVSDFLARAPQLQKYQNAVSAVLHGADFSPGQLNSDRRLDAELAEFFLLLAQSDPLIIAVSDLQWVDSLTMDVLCLLATANPQYRGRLFLAIDGRPSENVTRIAAANTLLSIELLALSKDDLRFFLSEIIQGDIPGNWLDRLYERTAGVILHVVQVLDTLAEKKVIEETSEPGNWRLLSPGDDLPVPKSLADILWTRIDRLPNKYRDIVLCAAVCGLRFPREMLPVAAKMPEDELKPILDDLVSDGFFTSGGGHVAFEHGSVREAARRMILRSERKAIAQRLIEHLGSRLWEGELRQLAMDLHYDAGKEDVLRTYRALDAHRYISAGRLADAKYTLDSIGDGEWGKDLHSQNSRSSYLMARARLSEMESGVGNAIQYYKEALTIAEEQTNIRGAAIILNALGRLAERLGDLDEADVYVRRALELSAMENHARGMAIQLNTLGRLAEKREKWDEALGHFERALELAESGESDPKSKSFNLNSLGRLAEKQQQWEKAIEFYEKAIDAMQATGGDKRTQAFNLSSIGRIAEKLRDWKKAFNYMSEAYEITRAMNDRRSLAFNLASIARVARAINDITASRAFSERAYMTYLQIQDKKGMTFVQGFISSLPATHDTNSTLDAELSQCLARLLSEAGPPPTLPDELIIQKTAPSSSPPDGHFDYAIVPSKKEKALLVLTRGCDVNELNQQFADIGSSRTFEDKFSGYEWGFYVKTLDRDLVESRLAAFKKESD